MVLKCRLKALGCFRFLSTCNVKTFAFDEVVNQEGQGLDDKTRWMAILATLIGASGKCQTGTEKVPGKH
jgi:hypothetical protein